MICFDNRFNVSSRLQLSDENEPFLLSWFPFGSCFAKKQVVTMIFTSNSSIGEKEVVGRDYRSLLLLCHGF